MGYLFAHYDENPPVIIVAMLICLAVFLFFGEAVILFYPDKVVVRDGSLVNYLLNKKGRTFLLKDIEQVSLPVKNNERPGVYATGVIVLLTAITPARRRKPLLQRPLKPIVFQLKDGSEAIIQTHLSDNSRQRIVDEVNALLLKGQ